MKVDFIIGAPTETEQDLKDLVCFIEETEVDDIFLHFLRYYPGTEIIQYALDHGHLRSEDISTILDGSETAHQILPDRIQGETRELYAKYNQLIRAAAGSSFRIEKLDYLLDEIESRVEVD